MPNKYVAVHQTLTGTGLPLINITGGTGVRLYLCHLILGSDATPADVAGEFVVALTDDAGMGGSAIVEGALDPLSPAPTGAAIGGSFSTDPASTANGNRLMIGVNQRATFTWWAREGFEIVSAAVAGDGFMTECTGMSSGTPNYNCTMMWYE